MTPTSPSSPSAAGSPSALCLLCGASNPPSASTCNTCGSPLSPAAPLGSDAGDLAGDFSGFARALPSHTSLRNGDYRILGVLGQGGFGITYRASNQRLEREVAIKEFFPATCERVGRSVSASGGLTPSDFDSLRAAFMEEARILARFELPAVVRVMGAWEENASAYMEMEILHGPTLAQVLEEREKLPVEATLRLFEPVIDALEAVHNAGWLHRDIKPHNIIFEPHLATPTSIDPKRMDLASCRAVLLDFGAAKKVAANVSQSFSVIVTPGYAPLEQYATRARRGAFTDVYALCATLYHALSGQAPPPASDRALHDDLIPLRELRPEVPPVVARAIEEGLQTSIARRPQTMSELRELLRGRGALQMAVEAAATEARDPKAGHLKARQQSILSNIQSINDPKSEQALPKPISSLPVSPEAQQMLHNATQGAVQNAAQPATQAPSQQPGIPASAIGKPLPTARPTYGGPQAGGGHRHRLENRNVPGTWSNGVYITAIGIGLLMLATAGPILSHFFAPAPVPPIEEPYRIEPLAAPAQAVIEDAPMSPDGRHVVRRGPDGHTRVWDVASKSPVLDAGRVAFEKLHRARWSPDGKYLLLVQCDTDASKLADVSHSARLFDVDARRLAWRKTLAGEVADSLVSWEIDRGSVWLCLNNTMRRFALANGRENTPPGSLAINKALKNRESVKIFEESPQWVQSLSAQQLRERGESTARSDAVDSGELSDKEANCYEVAPGVGSLDDLDELTLASARGHWFLQEGPLRAASAGMPTPLERDIRFVSFGGVVKKEWAQAYGEDEAEATPFVASTDGKVVARVIGNILELVNLETNWSQSYAFSYTYSSSRPTVRRLSSSRDGSLWIIANDSNPLRLLDAQGHWHEAPQVFATHARLSPDKQKVFWLNDRSGQMGELSLSDFTSS